MFPQSMTTGHAWSELASYSHMLHGVVLLKRVHDIHARFPCMHAHSHNSSYLCSQYRTIPTRLLSLLMEVSHLLSSHTTVGNWSGQEMPPLATTLQDNCMTAIHSQGQRKLRTLPA